MQAGGQADWQALGRRVGTIIIALVNGTALKVRARARVAFNAGPLTVCSIMPGRLSELIAAKYRRAFSFGFTIGCCFSG